MQIEHRIRTEIQGEKSYQAGKEQLAKYLKLEDVTQGYYVVFDYRQTPEPQVKTEQIAGMTTRSYVRVFRNLHNVAVTCPCYGEKNASASWSEGLSLAMLDCRFHRRARACPSPCTGLRSNHPWSLGCGRFPQRSRDRGGQAPALR